MSFFPLRLLWSEFGPVLLHNFFLVIQMDDLDDMCRNFFLILFGEIYGRRGGEYAISLLKP